VLYKRYYKYINKMAARISDTVKVLTKQYHDIQLYIDKLNKQIQEIRDKKKQIETQLITSLSTSGLQNQAITYQGKRIYISSENNYDTLTFKFLEQCLLKLFNNNQTQVKQILQFIKQERSKSSHQIIKMK
jgi:septal ring factor EnvC (AmiA/AmiB activator)